MKKLLSILGLAIVACVIVLAQVPTPDEARWNAGVYSFTHSATAGAGSIATRSAHAVIASNAASLTITNAGVTTNAVIFAVADQNHETNCVKAVIPAAGTFAIHTLWTTTNTLGVRYFILNY